MSSEDGTRVRPAPEPEARGERDVIDLGALRAAGRGSTVVVHRRRRRALSPDGGPEQPAPDDQAGGVAKAAKVFQLRSGAAEPAARAGTLAIPDDALAPAADGPPATAPLRRTRARRDPSHAPSRGTRIVFERPPEAAVEPAAAELPQTGVNLLAACALDPLYDEVLRGLRVLRADVEWAQRARDWRPLPRR